LTTKLFSSKFQFFQKKKEMTDTNIGLAPTVPIAPELVEPVATVDTNNNRGAGNVSIGNGHVITSREQLKPVLAALGIKIEFELEAPTPTSKKRKLISEKTKEKEADGSEGSEKSPQPKRVRLETCRLATLQVAEAVIGAGIGHPDQSSNEIKSRVKGLDHDNIVAICKAMGVPASEASMEKVMAWVTVRLRPDASIGWHETMNQARQYIEKMEKMSPKAKAKETNASDEKRKKSADADSTASASE